MAPPLNWSVMQTMIRLYALPIVLIIAGGTMASWAIRQPRYRDPNWSESGGLGAADACRTMKRRPS
jgi:hypothetical protein